MTRHPRRMTDGRPGNRHPATLRWSPQRALIVLAATAGAGTLLYPTAAAWSTDRAHATEVSGYSEAVAAAPGADVTAMIERAQRYNEDLPAGPLRDPYALNANGEQTAVGEGAEAYHRTLDLRGDGMMGRLNIPAIDADLPMYHGTSEETLASGVGHVYGSALPVGGTGRHAVLTSHSGLVSATLFTRLDEVMEGDRFTVTILNQVLTYQTDQILIVKPNQTDGLRPVDGKDYVTLVTCTPTAVNTHRLLVRGHGVPTPLDTGVLAIAPRATDPGFPWWALILGTVPFVVVVLTRDTRRECPCLHSGGRNDEL